MSKLQGSCDFGCSSSIFKKVSCKGYVVVLCFWPHFINRYCVHIGHFLVPRSQEQADSIHAAGMRFLRYHTHLLKVSSRTLELTLTVLGICEELLVQFVFMFNLWQFLLGQDGVAVLVCKSKMHMFKHLLERTRKFRSLI